MDEEDSSVELVLDNRGSPRSSEIKDEGSNSKSATESDEKEQEMAEVGEPNDNEAVDQLGQKEKESEIATETVELQYEEENEEIDNDPMNLLEMLDAKAPEEHSNIDSESTTSVEREEARWQRLTAKHTWCFREEENEWVYCVICNSVLRSKTQKSNLDRHLTSATHQERTREYMDFVKTLDKEVEVITSNVGCEYDIAYVKKNRENLEKGFLKFLFERWQESHEWLQCVNEDEILGYCKYCHQKISVLTSYQRTQHEMSSKHKENTKVTPKRRATFCGDLLSLGRDNSDKESLEDLEKESQSSDTLSINKSSNGDDWYEKSKSSADLCRCKLCDITMFVPSYKKHILSNLHRQNITALQSPGMSDKLEKPNWSNLQKQHPWIVEDPQDPMESYCTFCKKRILHGSSAAKRLIHEHSAAHRTAVDNFQKIENKEEQDDPNDNPDDQKNEKEDENEGEKIAENESEKESTSSEEKKNLKRKRTQEDFKTVFAWATICRDDPKYIYCKLCRIKFLRSNRSKHMSAHRHQEAHKIWLAKKSAQGNKKEHKKPHLATKAELQIMKDRISEWQKRYRWVRYEPGLLMNYAYCKYCKKSVFLASPRLASKHQRSSNHIRARNEASKQQTIKEDDKSGKDSASTDEGPPIKRPKPMSSLKRAIEAAKNLTEAHLRMLNFMRTSGRETPKNVSQQKLRSDNKEQTPSFRTNESKQLPLNSSSPFPDSMVSVVHQSRDTFDLFFNSMSETVKLLPSDLASEARLKVMQIIFELEMRAQKRQNLSNLIETPMVALSSYSYNNSILNETNNNLESMIEDASTPPPLPQPPSAPNLHPPQAEQPSLRDIRITNHQTTPNQPQKKHNYSLSSSQHNSNTQQNGQTYLMQASMKSSQRTPQTHFNYSPRRQNSFTNAAPQSSSTQHPQRTSTPQQRKIVPHPQQQQQQQRNSASQQAQSSGSILRQKLNSYSIHNINQRLNVNNTSMTFAAAKKLVNGSNNSNSGNACSTDSMSNNSSVNKIPKIRPVPLSSLTVKNYSSIDQQQQQHQHHQQMHHIQLNSSTQSRIIPIESNDPLYPI